MKTASVREVQHGFRHLLEWIADGESINVTSNRKIVARLVPPPPPAKKFMMPDFIARMRRDYPHEPVSDQRAADLIQEMRGER
jgi:antitoxin (DNA-binding transcriptional repressor) of toxin-antitoxin stability system